MLAKLRWPLVCLASLAGVTSGCAKQLAAQSLGAACYLDSDCTNAQVCVISRCHQRCTQSLECPVDQTCVSVSAVLVCQLPDDPRADAASPTSSGGIAHSGGGSGGSVVKLSVPGSGGIATGGIGGTPTRATATGGAITAPGTGGRATGGAGGAGGVTVAPPPDAAKPTDADAGPPDAPIESGTSTVLSGCGVVTTQRYFCDDFEAGLDKWQYGSDGWGLVTTSYQSASHSANDSPAGSYPKYAKNVLVTAGHVDLSAAISPVLTFWHKLALANTNAAVPSGSDMANTTYCGTSYSDVAYVQISTDGGTTRTTIKTYTCANNTTTWSFQQLSLAAYVGQSIRVAFRLDDTDSKYEGDGWYVDDVEIRETDRKPTDTPDGGGGAPPFPVEPSGCDGTAAGTRFFCDDFESGVGNWIVATNGWNTEIATAQSPTHSMTDSPNASYVAGAKTEMTMLGSVDLAAAVWPVLSYWTKLALANTNSATPSGSDMANTTYCGGSYSDNVYIDLSTDGGTSWLNLKNNTCSGNTSTWYPAQLSLSSFVGQKIKLRFRLEDTDSKYVGDGWHLDDIKIRENEMAPKASATAQGTVALFHFDGADGATRFLDSSGMGKALVPTGNPEISVVQSKFGGSSLSVSGTGTSQTNYLTCSGGSEFVFYGDFTVDWWQFVVSYPDVVGTFVGTASFGVGWSNTGANWAVGYDSLSTSITAATTNEWHHVALTRAGATYRAFVDGALVYTNTAYTGTKVADGILRISTYGTTANYGDFNGYLDELRVVNGRALWTAAFTPPTAAYPGN
jgi:hypothetical protein